MISRPSPAQAAMGKRDTSQVEYSRQPRLTCRKIEDDVET
jgi:hypothetical protein